MYVYNSICVIMYVFTVCYYVVCCISVHVCRSRKGYNGWKFSTVQFWGEPPEGTWKVKILDTGVCMYCMCLCVLVYACMSVCLCWKVKILDTGVCMYCMCVCVLVYACMSVCLCSCVYTSVCVCLCVRMHV